MNQLDLLYRAFAEYRRLTAGNAESARQRRAIGKANADADKMVSTRSLCRIEEDWIAEIEKGLVYVEKAVREERQFIRSEGEVVPIEKAKRVSKASVAHLARHANMITRKQENTDLVPEKLYIVEKLSDYAVYENRFLYMLLCYLRDFIVLRLVKISELGNTYRGRLHIKKDVTLGKRRLKCETEFTEVSRNDPYAFFDKDSLPLIRRIEAAQHMVASLLATPLMEQVAKTPMIKPPITKTNVLKMNVNFKAAVALYEYVAAYAGAGYKIEEVKKTVDPFPDGVADEVAELVTLASFLTYEYGNGIAAALKKNFDAEELRRREEEERAFLEKLKGLKRRVKETGKGLEEYALALEKRNRELESVAEKLRAVQNELAGANDRINSLNALIGAFDAKESELRGEIADLRGEVAAREAETARVKQQCAEAIAAAKAECEEELRAAAETHARELAEVRAAFAAETQALTADCEEKTAAAAAALAQAESEKTLLAAQLNGLRRQYGLTTATDDYTSKERFAELEKQYAAFGQLFEEQWKGTKKRIRRELFWKKDKKED